MFAFYSYLPYNICECAMKESSQMNEAKLIREIKEIVYYIRQYGINHVEASVDDIIGNETLAADFYTQVHKGFYFAQEKHYIS